MTENNEKPLDENVHGFQKASDAALQALSSVQPKKDADDDAHEPAVEVKNEACDKKQEVQEETCACESEQTDLSSDKTCQETIQEDRDSTSVTPANKPQEASKEEKPKYVSAHVYETPQVVPPRPEVKSAPVKPLFNETPQVPEVSHTHKPWFYAVAGGLAGLLVGAACVAGCTSIALHAGYAHKEIVPVPSVQAEESSLGSDSNSEAPADRSYEESNRDSEGYGSDTRREYGRDYGYGYGYGYPAPYGYGYGYDKNPYGYNYGYPYGYGYGYGSPYGYGYGYANPYDYKYGNPYEYDLEDLFDYLYDSDNGDEPRNDSSNGQKDSKEDSAQNSEKDSNDTGSYGGIIDLNELFGGDSSANSSSNAPVTMEEIMQNFDVSEGDPAGDTHSSGVYTVGKNGIEPGLYYLEGSDSQEGNFYIYEEDDDKNDAYELETAITFVGNYYIELEKGDVIVYKPADKASVFYSADNAPEVGQSPYGSGLYHVGSDIPAGTYKITASPDKIDNASQDRAAYVMKDLDFDDDSMLETKYVMAGGEQTIEVQDGQWLELYGASAELQK